MKQGLIGYTGFVGGNLLSRISFDALYNSKNIRDIEGKEFETLYCAGASAAKWKANQNPTEDLEGINSLLSSLARVKAERLILISTVDVYFNPLNVNESSHIEKDKLSPYGLHRYRIEEFVTEHFNRVHIIRLPGLFGKGLKKNIIYDFIKGNALHMIHCDSVFQFYNLSRIASDIQIVVENDVRLINFATEPVSVKEITLKAFDIDFNGRPDGQSAAMYNMKTEYAHLFGREGDYLMTKEELLEEIRLFVQNEIREKVKTK